MPQHGLILSTCMAIRPAARQTATHGQVFRRGFGNLPPRWDAEYSWRLYYVDLYFTDTFQYAKLYTMRYPVERILANLGKVMWDKSEDDKKNRHLWVRHDVDFSGDMTGAYQWMTDGLLAMRNVYELLG